MSGVVGKRDLLSCVRARKGGGGRWFFNEGWWWALPCIRAREGWWWAKAIPPHVQVNCKGGWWWLCQAMGPSDVHLTFEQMGGSG
jgi:hypothetical protein